MKHIPHVIMTHYRPKLNSLDLDHRATKGFINIYVFYPNCIFYVSDNKDQRPKLKTVETFRNQTSVIFVLYK